MKTPEKTKKQLKQEAVAELADQFETVSAWLEDTMYPRKDKLALSEALDRFKRSFPEYFSETHKA